MGLQDDLVEAFSWVDDHANTWPWFADARLFAAIAATKSPSAASYVRSM